MHPRIYRGFKLKVLVVNDRLGQGKKRETQDDTICE